MKRLSAWILAAMMAAVLAGCAEKTPSEKLQDDMNRMQKDLNSTAKKIQNDLK